MVYKASNVDTPFTEKDSGLWDLCYSPRITIHGGYYHFFQNIPNYLYFNLISIFTLKEKNTFKMVFVLQVDIKCNQQKLFISIRNPNDIFRYSWSFGVSNGAVFVPSQHPTLP